MSPAELFTFNKEPAFQYVGQVSLLAFFFHLAAFADFIQQIKRRIRGINTDVWIAPRVYLGLNSTWEW